MRCPSLSYFNPMDLAYERYGESSHLKEYSARITEDIQNIWSRNSVDGILLRGLVHKLVRKAGGLEYYPHQKYETMMMSDEEFREERAYIRF
jgi:hypothetical protein